LLVPLPTGYSNRPCRPAARSPPLFGWLVGTGTGAGIGLMFVGTAVCGAAMSFSGYLFRAIRCVEDELPDHDAAPVQAAGVNSAWSTGAHLLR
jgi:hypothetical protein